MLLEFDRLHECTYLSELADIANTLALEGAEVGSNTAVLEIDDSSERLVEERPNGQDWEVTGFGLWQESTILSARHQSIVYLQPKYGSLL